VNLFAQWQHPRWRGLQWIIWKHAPSGGILAIAWNRCSIGWICSSPRPGHARHQGKPKTGGFSIHYQKKVFGLSSTLREYLQCRYRAASIATGSQSVYRLSVHGNGRIVYWLPGTPINWPLTGISGDRCCQSDPEKSARQEQLVYYLRCVGPERVTTYICIIVALDDPPYPGNPAWAAWRTPEYVVYTETGTGNLVARSQGFSIQVRKRKYPPARFADWSGVFIHHILN
jgi:hypothetical protein